jgi:hypothetical protein
MYKKMLRSFVQNLKFNVKDYSKSLNKIIFHISNPIILMKNIKRK